MQIFIRGTAKLLAFNVENDDTVQDVYVSFDYLEESFYRTQMFQEYVAQESGYATDDLLLSFYGNLLNNEQELEGLDLVPGAIFDVSAKVLGGKTHGGLNRVGKVKGQTPKVNIFFKIINRIIIYSI